MSRVFKILSLSGGGIRGIYQAYFLKKLEEELEKPLSQYFDLICGTSTGAIVAMALATNQGMSKITELYNNKGHEIFRKRLLFGEIRRGPIYNQQILRHELEMVFGPTKLKEVNKHVIITATSINKVTHKIFSNLNTDNNDLNMPIVDIILSSTAAPTFFSPVKPPGGEKAFLDGGLWANSPAQVGLYYAHNIIGESYSNISLMSIGTSKSDDGVTLEKINRMRQLWFTTPKTIIDLLFSAHESYVNKYCLDVLGDERFIKVNSHTKEYISLDNVKKAKEVLPSIAELKVDEHINKIRKLFVENKDERESIHNKIRRSSLISDYLIEETGLSGFYPSREHYKTRGQSSSLESYISTAEEEIIFVSISLVKGINFDDLRKTLEKKLIDSKKNFTVTISLLNPSRDFLMESLAAVFEKDKNTIAKEITDTVQKLKTFREQLPRKKRKNLILRYHNAIPFGSAIIIDQKSLNAKIQIETKAYKTPHNKSFAFEIVPVHGDGFFKTLVDAYRELIRDGENII